jgi:hypothetical protein
MKSPPSLVKVCSFFFSVDVERFRLDLRLSGGKGISVWDAWSNISPTVRSMDLLNSCGPKIVWVISFRDMRRLLKISLTLTSSVISKASSSIFFTNDSLRDLTKCCITISDLLLCVLSLSMLSSLVIISKFRISKNGFSNPAMKAVRLVKSPLSGGDYWCTSRLG